MRFARSPAGRSGSRLSKGRIKFASNWSKAIRARGESTTSRQVTERRGDRKNVRGKNGEWGRGQGEGELGNNLPIPHHPFPSLPSPFLIFIFLSDIFLSHVFTLHRQSRAARSREISTETGKIGTGSSGR